MVGGAAVTEEFHPGFRNSVASYTVSLLNPQVIADMGLHGHGLRIVERPIANFLPIDETGYLKLGGGLERTQAEFAQVLQPRRRGAAGLLRHARRDRRRAARAWRSKTPPNVGDGLPGLMRGSAPGRPAGVAVPGAQARPAGPVHRERAQLPGRLVRERAGQGRLRLRRRGRQLRQSRQPGLGLCAAAPHLRRGERQEGRLGPRHRRHGRDHPGHGQGLRRLRASRS